ncbi:hypothetical protein FQN54_003858 [Arachnomyces sp. PD_36]|nr:hypothetical protein FQN54_003858 [Arachnomyces sp. PD_36]
MSGNKPTVLHIGDPIKHNPKIYERFSSEFNVIRPSAAERQRPAFIQALKERRWGDFHAIFRPFWNTGGEMGQWDEELISLLPETVKIFASAGAGYDWAQTDVLAKYGIVYCNGARASSEAVADTAIFHILSVFRNFTWSHLAARSGDPDQWTEAHKYATMTAFNPKGRSLGIIGLGNIGYRIAEKAYLGFGMDIYYNDIARKSTDQEKAVGATFFENLDEMLAASDCVVLATPFFGTQLINSERLTKFKKGSRFVNIARGTLVDEDALASALESGHIFAAGLDVHAHEPHVHPGLIKMRNVTLTSHNAGGALDTNIGFESLAMENIEEYLLRGKALTPVRCNEQRPRCSHCERLNLQCNWKASLGQPTRNAGGTAGGSTEAAHESTDQRLPGHQPVSQLFDYASFMWDDSIAASFPEPSFSGLEEPDFRTFSPHLPTRKPFNFERESHGCSFSPSTGNLLPIFPGENASPSTSAERMEEDHLIIYFLQAVVPPILEPIETGPRWALMRSLFASMATASSMVRCAIKAFSALQSKTADYRPFYEKTHEDLATFFDAAEAGPEKIEGQFQYMLAAMFLVTYIDLVIGQVNDAHVNLKKTYLVIQKVDKGKFSSTEKRLISWVRLIDARAVSAGGEGLFLSDDGDDSVYYPNNGQPSPATNNEAGANYDAEIEEILFDVIYQPGIVFFQKVQSFMGRISKIDIWHRSRGTVKDETEVMSIAAGISDDLKSLYDQRPALMDHAVAGRLSSKHLAESLVPVITRSFRTYLANYYASFIHLHRVAYKHLPRTSEVDHALSMIKHLVKLMSQSQEALPVNIIWPLLMLGSEEENIEDRQWILEIIRGLEHVATNASITSDVLEEVQRRQDQAKERTDIRQVMQDTHNSSFAIV